MAASADKSPLCGRRIPVCGKGGSGKSTVVALVAAVLRNRACDVLVVDGDAPNPEGLVRLLFGLGVAGEPRPLVEFFGGLDRVTRPVDDPSPLTRTDESVPVPERPVDFAGEIPFDYHLHDGRMTLLQVGKIQRYGQGCDGSLE